MQPFTYSRATETGRAIADVAGNPQAAFLAGGTNLIDNLKLNVQTPLQLVDINGLTLNKIEMLPEGGVRIGALVRNSDLAYDEIIRKNYPVLSEALLSGASAQLRNAATTGGNLLQRTRCYYFRDTATPCNKREPGSGCPAIEGYNRIHAVLGTSTKCIATHPSDMCVAMNALDAVVLTQGPKGARRIAINDFHLLPGDTPQIETVLEHGELITGVELPPSSFAAHSHYVKVRDRASYAFALVSVAAALDIQNGVIAHCRIALGGVAHKPWRALEAEKALVGKPANETTFKMAAEAALHGAKKYKYNGFKPDLAKRTIVRTLTIIASMAGMAGIA